MKTTPIIFFLILFQFICISCDEDNINSIPLDFGDASVVYADSTRIVNFINNIYTYVPGGFGRVGNAFFSSATDESVFSPEGTNVSKWAAGSWGPTFLPDNSLPNSYKGIRATYVYQNQIHPNVLDEIMSDKSKMALMGQVYFLRALFNFQIIQRFGGYPIVLGELESVQNLSIPRSTYDECVDYIKSLCDSANTLLPVSVNDANLGRATKGAALALKSRLLLYAASPLYNSPDKSEDDPMHGKYDQNKWSEAAAAAYEVINLKDVNQQPVYNLSPNRVDLFSSIKNKEIIFNKLAQPQYNLEYQNSPVGLQGARGGNCPTLNLVDAYDMENGEPFNWDNEAMAENPFSSREPRFYEDILYNGSKYIGGYTVNTAQGGEDLKGIYATRTGFYLRKFMNVNARWWGTTSAVNHSYIIFRFAEILLNYAEAMNEAYGPDSDPNGYGLTSRDAIRMIRTRARLTQNKDLASTVPTGDKELMRDAIRKERQIELAFEDHRIFDVRRWKIAEEVLNVPAYGLKITENGDGSYTYEKIISEERVFSEKMYYYPFPLTEINRNNALKQNLGWN